MEDLASLGFRIDSSGLRRATTELDRMDGASGRADRSTRGLTSASTMLAGALGAVVGTLGAAGLINKLYETAKSTQVLQASLKTVTGSLGAATEAWDGLLEFAKTTPFTLDQSVQGFIRMKSLGLDPTEKALRSFGNTSAAMGKDLMQMIEAVADASTGEFERLKEFGIRASKQGDQVSFTFQGIETTVKNSSDAITGYLEGIGNTQFAGAMADQMDTLSGQVSNLEDSIDGLFRSINDAGATLLFEASISTAADAVQGLTDNLYVVLDAAAVVAIVIGGKLAGALAIGTAAFVANSIVTIQGANAQALASQALVRRTFAEKAATISTLERARAEVASTLGTQANAAALVRQTAAVNAASVASLRHGAALAGQTTAMTAASVAARGLASVMALLGGPVGVAIIAAASLFYFREELGFVRPEITAATGEVDAFVESLDGITEASLRLQIENIKTEIQEVAAAAEAASKRLVDAGQMTGSTTGGGFLGVSPGAITEFTTGLSNAADASRELQIQSLTLQEQLEAAEIRMTELVEAREAREKSSAAASTASANARTAAAARSLESVTLELEYLRMQNALVLAGVAATEAEIIVMEAKKRLQLESQGLTAGQALEYIELEKSIRASIEAQLSEEQMLQELRDRYGDTTKAAKDYADQIELLNKILVATGDPEIARMIKRLSKEFKKAGEEAAYEFENPFESVADSVSQSIQDAIAGGEWGSIGEGIGNALAASMSAIVSKQITDSLSEGITKDSAAISQISAAFAGPIAGAVVGGLVQLAIAELASFLSFDDYDPTEARQAAQGTGTVLGSIDAKSSSIAKATELTASTNEELVNINTGMLRALQNVQSGILGASARVARGASNQDLRSPSVMSGDTLGTIAQVALAATGPIGLVVALVFGDLLKGLFGGKSKKVDEGIRIIGGSINDLIQETVVQSFATFRVKKNFLSSTKTKERFQDLGDDVGAQFALVFESLVDSVAQGALQIGLIPDDIQSAINQFTVDTQKISLEGLSAAEKTAEIEAVFSTIFDDLATAVVPFLDDFQRAGEGLGETLARVATQIQLTREAATSLGFALSDSLGPEMMAGISDSLIQLVGGIEAFATAITAFESNFFSEAEQFEINARRLAEAMGDLPLAETRQGFVDLLRAQDVTTASGRETVATLLRLQDAADDYYSYLEDAADAAAQAAEAAAEAAARQAEAQAAAAEAAASKALQEIISASDQALSELRSMIDSEIAAIQAQRQELETSLQSSTATTDRVFGALKGLVGAEKQAAQDRLDITTAAINEENNLRLSANKMALDAAKNGLSAIAEEAGLLKSAFDSLTDAIIPQSVQFAQAIAKLRDALRTGDLAGAGVAATEAAGVSSEGFATRADFAVAQGQAAFLVSQLNDQAQGQLSTAEQTIQRLESQTDVIRTSSDAQIESANLIYENEVIRLDGILENASLQIEEQRRTTEKIISVDSAIAILKESLTAELQAQQELDAFTGEQQIESLNLIYDNALMQLNELRGVNRGIVGVSDALLQFKGAMSIERAASQVADPVKLQALSELYNELLGRYIGPVGAEYWAGKIAEGYTQDDLREGIMNSPEFKNRVPAFAGGGMHSGGMRLVGERGPELEVTGSSKIMSNSELMSSLGGNKQLAEEMRSMHSDMVKGLSMIAKNTDKNSKQLERWDLTGLPQAREFV